MSAFKHNPYFLSAFGYLQQVLEKDANKNIEEVEPR